MMFFGFAEVLMLALLTGSGPSTDLIGMVPPADYFKNRDIEISIDKAVEYAGEEPKDPKAQIVQLASLRYLAGESESLKKSPKYAAHRQALDAIAQGKKAQDPEGFAKDYANRLLEKLDNKKPAALKLRPIREDGLGWFPADTTLAGVLDLQHARQGRAVGGADAIAELLKNISDREKKEMYDFIEKTGNLRVDRIAFGYVEAPKRDDAKIFIRFSGKGNQKWLADAFSVLDRGRMQTKNIKDDKGVPIVLMQEKNNPPVIMMVGNTDLMVFGYSGNTKQSEDLLTEVLEARSKKKASAADGFLKDRMKKIPDKAVALLVGDIPEEMKREFRFVFDTVPPKILAFIERAPQGLDVQVEAGMANAEDAGKVVQKVGMLRKDGIAGLQQMAQQGQQPGDPPIPFQALINLMESLQVQSQAEKVQIRLVVPDTLVNQLPLMMMPRRVEKFK